MKQLTVLLLFSIFLYSCSSADLVSNWKNPDYVIFDAHKVLVVGMTQNEAARVDFESKLVEVFKKQSKEAERSIDLFDVHFTASEKSESQLTEVEQQLLDKDFDAILFTKVVGTEEKQSLRSKHEDAQGFYNLFRDDYLSNQEIYYKDDYYETYTVFHAETSLYCICVGKERQLIWTAGIDITDPKNFEKSIDDYIELLVVLMEDQDLILRKNRGNERVDF